MENAAKQCQFFEWDDNHCQTNIMSQSSTSWVHKMMWFRFEAKHGYSLTFPRGCYSPDHVRQGAMGDCWFLSALVSRDF